MKNKTKGCVYFYINADDLDPDMCTSLIGVPPTRAYRKGDSQGGKRPLARTGHWEVRFNNDEMREINTDTEALLDILLPSKIAIRKILRNIGIEAGIFCVVCAHDAKPCLRLSAKCLCKLSEIGVDYEIDYYDYTGCNGEE